VRRVSQKRGLLILILVGACTSSAPPERRLEAASRTAAALDPKRFEPEIRAFETADRAHRPKPNGIVFIGSSSIKNWTDLAADFPGLPVLNRGFGGSTLADVVYYMDRILIPYRPRRVVLYAGDNDMVEGRTPEEVMADYRAFIARLRSALPEARVVYISIKPSPSRRIYIDRMRETNQRIRAEIARDSLQTYVDIFTPMLNATGQPRPELFLADSLHMTRAGYLLWRSLLEAWLFSWQARHNRSEALQGGRMPGEATRVSDMYTCPRIDGVVPHVGGPILPPGAPTVLIAGMPAATVGQEVQPVPRERPRLLSGQVPPTQNATLTPAVADDLPAPDHRAGRPGQRPGTGAGELSGICQGG
jgi:lysophospholipase L1-like esterase